MTRTRNSILFLTLLPLMHPAPAISQGEPETVCIQCHAPLAGRPGAPVAPWRKSIHAANGISCHSCHGGDAKDAANAMLPARGFMGVPAPGEIPSFCGRCHPGVLKDYLASAHGKALGKGGPTCVTCHGSHQVLKASLQLINEKSCSRCHSFERARIIRDAMQKTEEHIERIERRTALFRAQGVDTERLEKGLFAVRNRFHSLFHEVNVARVNSEAGLINAELAKLDAELRRFEDARRRRWVAGAAAVSLLLLIAFLCHLLRRSYRKKE